jgi:hypothetical protein
MRIGNALFDASPITETGMAYNAETTGARPATLKWLSAELRL